MAMERVRDIYVEDIMTKVPVIGSPNLTARDIAILMRSWKVGSVIILEDGRPIGIVTERDFVEKIVAEDRRPADVKAGEIMSSPVVTIGPRESVAEAGRKMGRMRLRRLPVVEGDQLIGMLTENDITRLSPSLIELTREWRGISTPVEAEREPVSMAGYCENCENYSYDLRQTGGASGRGGLLCAECREIFIRDPTQ
ncbi:MAG TPA: CBS domain-containing protein [Euryarchaeota archaeon]|nr:CBS domain-containing protein [Euryarchaeota archaeon]HQD88213.1 CBS domain-containing protein [Methanomassiliicoccaceae archaeon]